MQLFVRENLTVVFKQFVFCDDKDLDMAFAKKNSIPENRKTMGME